MAEDPNPVEFLPSHLPRTELKQLTDALAAGLITPELFALAKEKLGHTSPATPPASEPAPVAEVNEPIPATAPEYATGDLPPLTSFFNESPPAATPDKPPLPAVAPSVVVDDAISALLESPALKPLPRAMPPELPLVVAPANEVSLEPPFTFVGNEARVYDELLTSPAQLPARRAAAAAPPVPGEESAQPTWFKVVLLLVVLGILGLIYQQVVGSHPDEQLATPRPPSAETTVVFPTPAIARPHSRRAGRHTAPKSPKTSKPTTLPKSIAVASVRQLVRVATTNNALESNANLPAPTRPVAATPPAPMGTPPEPMPQPIPAAPEAGDSEGATRVRAVLAAYYADILAPPFAAARHFAPHVERLYIQQNLTPADINANFARSFFPDNQQAVFQVERGTLRVSSPVADGSRVATFVEASRIYHPSRRGYQRLRAQVRVRFNADYQIVYLRQERLLESIFE